jgi:hypothetical protein
LTTEVKLLVALKCCELIAQGCNRSQPWNVEVGKSN